MNVLSELLGECINLMNEIYDVALVEELNNVKNKSSILIKKLNRLFEVLLDLGFQINPLIMNYAENLIEAIEVGDCIAVVDIVGFEMKPILEKYLESIGE
jgi:hypothetical protein